MNLCRTVAAAIALAAIFAAGGCGGSSDVKGECQEYCDAACAKAQECGALGDLGFESLDRCVLFCGNQVGNDTATDCSAYARELAARGCDLFGASASR